MKYDTSMLKLNVKKIEFELKRLGWNQSRLAEETGMTRQGVSIALIRQATLLRTIDKFAKALGVHPRDLLK